MSDTEMLRIARDAIARRANALYVTSDGTDRLFNARMDGLEEAIAIVDRILGAPIDPSIPSPTKPRSCPDCSDDEGVL